MSGIEIAGLALGVLPILIEVVKCYSTISKKAHTLRYYSTEIESISKQLKVHKGIFLNEVRLLLRSIEDEEEVESMLADASDQRWTSKRLNDKLSAVLQGSFEICRSIVEETKDIIEAMKEEMSQFDVLLEQRSKTDKSLKSTLKRLGGAIKITFDKSRHDRCLANLRDRNGELSALRSQISAFQQQDVRKANTCNQHKALPNELSRIQNTSKKLHEALCGAWRCDDAAHRGHCAKLCIEAEVQSEVRLDLAMSCHEPGVNGNNRLLQEPPIWLYVQSMSMSEGQSVGRRSGGSAIDVRPSLPLELVTSCAVNVVKKKASADLSRESACRKKAKRVHFSDASAAHELVPSSVTASIGPLTADFNLCQTKNICRYLQSYHQESRAVVIKRCIGYLESPQLYKHLFYFRENNRATHPVGNRPPSTTIYSVSDLMGKGAAEVLEVEDQLRLAHKIALATLQYNDTPWLNERWRLRDLSYLGSKDSFDRVALQTLHLSSQITSSATSIATNSSMDGIERAEDVVSDEIRYGINNTTLFFLGVALLEIAHWKPIEENMTARDLNTEVFAARRLATSRAPLGQQYLRIAQKCLQCNFGFGTKLSSKGLQTAVYNDVVCGLEKLIIDEVES